MPNSRHDNPFYPVLMVVGAVFGVTALAFASASVMAQQNPSMALEARESGRGLIAFMDAYGFRLLMIELILLTIATLLAMGTDDYWTRRAEQAKTKDDSANKASDQADNAETKTEERSQA